MKGCRSRQAASDSLAKYLMSCTFNSATKPGACETVTFAPLSEWVRDTERDRETERQGDREHTATISSSSSCTPSLSSCVFQHTLTRLPSDADWMQTGGFPAASWVCPPSPPSPPPPSASGASPLLPPLYSRSSPPGCGTRWLCSSLDSLLWSTVSLPVSLSLSVFRSISQESELQQRHFSLKVQFYRNSGIGVGGVDAWSVKYTRE